MRNLLKFFGVIFAFSAVFGILSPESSSNPREKPKVSAGTKTRKIEVKKPRQWWMTMAKQCMQSEKTPEEYLKRFPCKIAEKQKNGSIVFIRCEFETAVPGETVGALFAFTDSLKECEKILDLDRSLNQAQY